MNIYLHGNCQTQAMRDIILETNPDWNVACCNLGLVSFYTEEMIQAHLKRASEADIVIAQPVGDFQGHKELSTEALKAAMRPGATIVTFPSIVFEGLQGAFNYFKNHIKGYRSDYHNAHTIDMYLSGYHWDDIVMVQESPEYYTKEFVEAGIDASLTELGNRESLHNVDVRLAKYFEERCRSQVLMNSINHPKRFVLVHVLTELFRKLDLTPNFNLTGKDYLPYPQFPPLPTVLYHLGMKDETPEIVFEGKPSTRREHVVGSLTYYSRLLRPQLREGYAGSRTEEFIHAFRKSPLHRPDADKPPAAAMTTDLADDLVKETFAVFLRREAAKNEIRTHSTALRAIGMREWFRVIANAPEFMLKNSVDIQATLNGMKAEAAAPAEAAVPLAAVEAKTPEADLPTTALAWTDGSDKATAEPVIPEPVIPEPVIPEPVVPAVITEATITEPVVAEAKPVELKVLPVKKVDLKVAEAKPDAKTRESKAEEPKAEEPKALPKPSFAYGGGSKADAEPRKTLEGKQRAKSANSWW